MKSINKIPLAILIASIISPLSSLAQTEPGQANWGSISGNYWKTSSGQCWRSSTWTPAVATEKCDDIPKPAEAPAPAPKVAEAPPPPPPAPAPVQYVPTQVSFSAEDLFDFNRSELKENGKAKLDTFADELKNTKYDTILATGHSDRIGNKKYNQKLSEQRAEAVRSYLVSKGVPADRIRAEGRGESEPVTAAGDCKMKARPKLIACLQPDRRVEVRVNATRDVPVKPQ